MFYKVSKLNEHIGKTINDKYDSQIIPIVGELSGFKTPIKGTYYFTLKDEHSSIGITMYENVYKQLTFIPKDGMEVGLEGKVNFFNKKGTITFKATSMVEYGAGDLHKKFELMKTKLKDEGLFEQRHKKMIPSYPKVIGIITSRAGAVISDIVQTVTRRYPLAKLELYPVAVQGPQSVKEIIKAIDFFNKKNTADVLIVGRGGGSIEDLWAFNEESIARAIFDSNIPLVSAVGHETDHTIADLVADKRASTPTAAAELVTPFTLRDLSERTNSAINNLNKAATKQKEGRRKQIDFLRRSILSRHPKNKLNEMKRHKESLTKQLSFSMEKKNEKLTGNFNLISQRLHSLSPSKKISDLQLQVVKQRELMKQRIKSITEHKEYSFSEKAIRLETLSPLRTMSRGYTLTYKNGVIVKDINSLAKDDQVEIKMKNGEFNAIVKDLTINKEEVQYVK
jgi:exodeoxyribonuclease VII large subunit